MKYEEEDLVLKVGESLEARVKERSQRAAPQFPSSTQSLEDIRGKGTALGGAASFSDDDEDATQLSGSKSATRGRKASSQGFKSARDTSEVAKTSTRGRGRGRGRGRDSSKMKQTTLDAAMVVRHSGRSASAAATASVRSIATEEENLDSGSSDEAVECGVDEIQESSDDEENLPGKGRKRAAPRGRGRASGSTTKRGRKSDNTSSSSIQKILMSKDDEDDDDDDLPKRIQKSQPRVTRNYGALRR